MLAIYLRDINMDISWPSQFSLCPFKHKLSITSKLGKTTTLVVKYHVVSKLNIPKKVMFFK